MQGNYNSTLENRGWEGMKVLLDQHMPARGRRYGWLYALVGVIALFMAGYFFTKKENVQPENQPHPSLGVPVAIQEQPSDDTEELETAEIDQELVETLVVSEVESVQHERMEGGLSNSQEENAARGDAMANELDGNYKGHQEAVYEMVVKGEVEAEQIDRTAELEPYYPLFSPLATLSPRKPVFSKESASKNEIISIGMSKRNAFYLSGQVQAGLVSFPGYPLSGIDMGMGASLTREGSPWSLDVDLGFGRVVHGASAFGFASQESDRSFNSGSGVPTGSKGNIDELASGDHGLIDPARLDIILDAITAWDRFYSRLTVSRHIHGGLRLGAGMALQYVSKVEHNSVVYYEGIDPSGIRQEQYLELEEGAFSQLGWIRTYIPSASVELEYRFNPNWSVMARYEQDLAGIVRSGKSSLPHYESDSRLGLGVKWRFN